MAVLSMLVNFTYVVIAAFSGDDSFIKGRGLRYFVQVESTEEKYTVILVKDVMNDKNKPEGSNKTYGRNMLL